MADDIHDWSRPSVQAYVRAVLALAPADWDRLASACRQRAAEELIARARSAGHPDPGRALQQEAPPPRGWRRVAANIIDRGMTRVHDASLGPAWQRQGVGPARLLYERFQHPYVSRAARSVVELGLGLLWSRPSAPTLERPEQRQLARLLNEVLPWDAIWTTPDADGSVGRLSHDADTRPEGT